MKKILGLTVAALLVMGLVGGGTWAYFTDVETSTGNVFTTGTLDLSLSGGTQAIDSVTATWTSPAGWAPGDSYGPTTLTLDNVGTTDMTLVELTVTTVDGGGSNMAPYTGASSEPEYVAEGGTYVGTTEQNDNVAIDDISSVINVTLMTYNGTDLLAQGSPPAFDDATIEAADTAGNNDGVLQLDELATISGMDLIAAAGLTELAGDGVGTTTHDFIMTFQLAGSTDNEYQGDISTMSVSILGKQQ